MTRNDRIALKLALATCRNESAGRARQIDAKLESEAWEDVAHFAAFCCQSRTLLLEPWSLPPCSADEDDDGAVDAEAVRLLRKMLAAGVSRYHPDPMTALEEAKKRKVKRAA
jgi:hypothetical protein